MDDNLPALELLASTHVFPGPYVFKVIAQASDGFLAQALAAVRMALNDDADPPYRLRETASGRHIAVTLQPVVQSPQQVLAVYRRLKLLAGLVVLW